MWMKDRSVPKSCKPVPPLTDIKTGRQSRLTDFIQRDLILRCFMMFQGFWWSYCMGISGNNMNQHWINRFGVCIDSYHHVQFLKIFVNICSDIVFLHHVEKIDFNFLIIFQITAMFSSFLLALHLYIFTYKPLWRLFCQEQPLTSAVQPDTRGHLLNYLKAVFVLQDNVGLTLIAMHPSLYPTDLFISFFLKNAFLCFVKVQHPLPIWTMYPWHCKYAFCF